MRITEKLDEAGAICKTPGAGDLTELALHFPYFPSSEESYMCETKGLHVCATPGTGTWQRSRRGPDRVLCDGIAGNNIKRITSRTEQPDVGEQPDRGQ
jgi:hypothetical protein